MLRTPGESDRLWRAVMPGVPEALARLRGLGLALAVVGNADGTVERSLTRLGLRRYFDAVHDSAVVGFEKPDPRIFLHALAQAAAAQLESWPKRPASKSAMARSISAWVFMTKGP